MYFRTTGRTVNQAVSIAVNEAGDIKTVGDVQKVAARASEIMQRNNFKVPPGEIEAQAVGACLHKMQSKK